MGQPSVCSKALWQLLHYRSTKTIITVLERFITHVVIFNVFDAGGLSLTAKGQTKKYAFYVCLGEAFHVQEGVVIRRRGGDTSISPY